MLQLAVAVAYLVAALLGLKLDAVSGFASLVWPASGIALAATLLAGNRVLPAIAAGAFTANLIAGAPIVAALGVALGNTSAALLGAVILRRIPGFDTSLEKVRDVAVIALAAVSSPIVSASAGTGVLSLAGIIDPAEAAYAWRAWWLGDTIGDLIVAPVILVWARRPDVTVRARNLEAALLGFVLILVTLAVFATPQFAADVLRSREYMVFPMLMWAAIRFGIRGSVTAALAVMIVAVIQTSTGHGPFVGPELHESLYDLQVFIGITGATFLILGASVSERARAAAELGVARETAESANRAKAGFLAAVSHELRTPLNAITGYVDLLSLEVHGPLTDKQRSSLGRIADSQRHLLRLIDDVLGYAQVEAGRLSLTLEPVIVADVVASVEPLAETEMSRKGLTFEIEQCEPSLAVRADGDKLRQVLLNLVMNSAKFTNPPGTITLSAKGEGDRVVVCVSDTGIGIPADHLPYVFNPFFQVEQGATRRYAGVGLGLSIVRELVAAMDGDVTIDSEVGRGTRVTVSLEKC